MPENTKIIVKMYYPLWLTVFYTILYGVVVFMITWYLFFYPNQILQNRLWEIAILFLFLLIALLPLLHYASYSVIATNEGVERRSSLGVKKKFAWTEIVDVRRPKLKIPLDAIYIVTKDNTIIEISKDMRNVHQMIDFIKHMSPMIKKQTVRK